MVPLSVCIIAKNEAEALRKSLPSVNGWAEEILVITNDCTDDTPKVAEALGAIVIEHKWEGYSQQRNFAQQQAHKDWIMRLDADEVVSDELKHSIEEFFANEQLCKSTTLCECYRHNQYLGCWLKHFNDKLPLLLKKSETHWENDVHEKVVFRGKVIFLKGILYHYTEKSVQDTLAKRIKYAQLAAIPLAQKYSKHVLALKAVFNPMACFFKCYFFRKCFLEGFAGLYYSIIDALYTFLKYTFAFELKIKA